jgi:hypothetical protein
MCKSRLQRAHGASRLKLMDVEVYHALPHWRAAIPRNLIFL